MARIAEKLAKMADDASDYVYLPIIDAKKLLNMKVNLFARITEVGLPWRSKGTDYCLILKIIDNSCSAQALSVNFFSGRKENLPIVKCAGDVICLHQVEMKIYNGDVYFLFNKRFSSFALFDGKSDMGLIPYQTSASYRATDHANELLVQLRTLSLEKFHDAGLTTSLSLLRNIESGKVFDMICKVLHVRETSEGEWMLFIWDGTDAPLIVFQANLDLEKRNVSVLHEPLLLSRETLCSFPCVGTVLRVTIGKFFEDIHCLQDGDHWVKLYNVFCEIQSEIWTGTMSSSSRIFILSDEDGDVKYRKRLYSERIASNIGRVPLLGFLEYSHITETDYEKVAYATLMDSITNSQVVHRCKCVVRVVASYPWRGGDLRSPVDGRYRLKLTLEDATARVHAHLLDEEGVKFFRGNLGAEELTKKMTKLLGIMEPSSEESEPASRNPPWIKCCLMSYYLDENDPWGSRSVLISSTSFCLAKYISDMKWTGDAMAMVLSQHNLPCGGLIRNDSVRQGQGILRIS